MRWCIISVVLAAGSVACSGGETEPPACQDPSATTSVTVADFSYSPDCLSVEGDASLALDNQGDAPHTFTLEGADLSVDVPAGDQATADFSGIAAGTYTVICTYHPQMKAVVRVGDASTG
jgi:plastocyanin